MDETQPETFARRARRRLRDAAFLAVGAAAGTVISELIQSHSLTEAVTTGVLVAFVGALIYLALQLPLDARTLHRERRARERS